MIYGSVCSGIEAATVAWHPLGWHPAWFCETEPFSSAVLRYHYPDIPNLGDITRQDLIHDTTPIDLFVGGTPCQAFSIAGNRAGFDDSRGNLTLRFLELVGEIRPTWLVWENVPGVLSIDSGRTFGTILAKMAEHGYGWAYRILDAQWFGVPQRRRRVFVVGHSGGQWQRSAEVLAISEGLPGNPPTRQTPEEDVTGNTGKGPGQSGVPELAATIHARDYKGPASDGLRADTASLVPYRMRGFGDYVEDETTGAILERDHKDHKDLVVTYDSRDLGDGKTVTTLVGDHAGQVRRLTPVECERLQGFPDNYTRIPWRGKPAEQCPDGPRYKALGNSMAVPVMQWLAQQIQQTL